MLAAAVAAVAGCGFDGGTMAHCCCRSHCCCYCYFGTFRPRNEHEWALCHHQQHYRCYWIGTDPGEAVVGEVASSAIDDAPGPGTMVDPAPAPGIDYAMTRTTFGVAVDEAVADGEGADCTSSCSSGTAGRRTRSSSGMRRQSPSFVSNDDRDYRGKKKNENA